MILVAGLSPAWQQIMEFERFEPGEVNRARSVHWCASGKVLNVAIALKQLGAPCQAVTVLGGASGAAIERELGDSGLPLKAVRSAGSTRVCTTILELGSKTTELVENAASISAAELQQFCDAFVERAAKAQFIVLTGSMPAGTDPTTYRELIADCAEWAILDLRGPELLTALKQRPLLVKPNRLELGQTLGRELDSESAVHEAMEELRRRGAQWVVVTDGPGAVWISGPDGHWRGQPVKVPTVNPIGCGDCLAAGIAVGLLHGSEMFESIRYGIAAAAENASMLLPCRLDPARVEELTRQVAIERI
jgi:1-phosphofructokinase family hexose kinase